MLLSSAALSYQSFGRGGYNGVERAVEWFVAITSLVVGASHLLRPGDWAEAYRQLHRCGRPGAFANGALHLAPGALLVAGHPSWVWPGPGWDGSWWPRRWSASWPRSGRCGRWSGAATRRAASSRRGGCCWPSGGGRATAFGTVAKTARRKVADGTGMSCVINRSATPKR